MLIVSVFCNLKVVNGFVSDTKLGLLRCISHSYTSRLYSKHPITSPVQVCHIAVNTLKRFIEPVEHFNMVFLKLLISVLKILENSKAFLYIFFFSISQYYCLSWIPTRQLS